MIKTITKLGLGLDNPEKGDKVTGEQMVAHFTATCYVLRPSVEPRRCKHGGSKA